MKIILVHYRFFISGGPERYMFNIISMLESQGHEVIPFSVKHNKNFPSKYEEDFLEPVGTGDEVYGHEYKRDLNTVTRVLGRMIYSFEAKRKLKRLIRNHNPDLVYVLQFQNKMSCSVIDAAFELKVPIVQRISDFGHICINNSFFDFQSNMVCEDCLKGLKANAVKKKCFNQSRTNSLIKAFALKIQEVRKTTQKISEFIIPAKFTVSKFIEFGIPPSRITHIPTFFNPGEDRPKSVRYGDFFLYVGRVEVDKGLLTLVKAFENTDLKLIIVGFSSNGYDDYLKKYLEGKHHNITFTGKLDFNQIKPYLEECICTICPSEWYDNMPNAVLESYAYEKAVIASELGSLIDIVEENKTGLHFQPKDHVALRNCAVHLFENRDEAARLGHNAYMKLITEYAADEHCRRLVELFNKVVSESKRIKIANV